MENFTIPLNRGERRAIHLAPNKIEVVRVMGGINYNLNTLHLKYDNKYSGTTITVTYSDANGNVIEYARILEFGGIMNWMNEEPIEQPNFANIGFSARQEVFFEFSFS